MKNKTAIQKRNRKNISRATSRVIKAGRAKSQVRNGRLYLYNGQVVRALQVCSNGLRLIGIDGSLFGFAKDADLKKI